MIIVAMPLTIVPCLLNSLFGFHAADNYGVKS